jgi:hypothetical protein
MVGKTSIPYVRADDELKERAQAALEPKVPNAETRAAMAEAEAMVNARNARFKISDAF